MIELNRDDMIKLLTGCAFLGTGGGGELSAGLRYIDEAIAAGKKFKLASLNELEGTDMICTPYALGSTEPTPLTKSQERLPNSEKPPILLAVEGLAKYSGVNFAGAVSCEMGGENTAVAAFAAAMMDGFIVDADAAGRAVPEITHSTYYLNRLPVSPVVMANAFGETVVCDHIFDDQRAEEIARQFAQISRNDIAAADHPLSVEDLKGNIIEGTLSRAFSIGALLLDETLGIEETCEQISEMNGGAVFFRGEVSSFESRVDDGFTVGTLQISGTDSFAGKSCDIDIKNENMLARINGEIAVTIPELICIIRDDAKQPVTNPNASVGEALTVMVLPAPQPFRTPRGLEVFGPTYLGLDQPFKPVC